MGLQDRGTIKSPRHGHPLRIGPGSGALCIVWRPDGDVVDRRGGVMARLLVIHHSPTRAVAGITESVLAGCHDEAIEDVEIVACRAPGLRDGERDG
jgi:hypothetical protein